MNLERHALELHRQATIVNGVAIARGSLQGLVEPMVAGGVTGANWTIPALDSDVTANDLPSVVRAIARISHTLDLDKERTMLIRSSEDLLSCKANGSTGIILGLQDTLAIEDRLELIQLYHSLGVRIIQLTYQRRNLVGDGCGEPFDAGLSAFGKMVVGELNRVGILIDLSHVGARTTAEAIDSSSVPCAFTHANPYAFHANARNKTDDAIRHLARRGGVIGISAISRYMSSHGRTQATTPDDLVDQVEYVANLVGEKHVGLGLDITEGMSEEDFGRRLGSGLLARLPELQAGGPFSYDMYYPVGLRSMAHFPRITEALVRRGFSDEHILHILGGNFVRVFREAWERKTV